MEINILSPASSASAFYLCGLGLCFGCGGVRWFRPSVGCASLGLNEGWYLAKGALPSERDLWDEEAPRSAPEGRVPCFTSQPCMTDLLAGTWLGEAALPIPTPVGPGVQPSSSHAPRHLPWGQQDQGWGVGPHQEPQPYRALNGRSCSQVPRTEVPAPASATLQEPWPGERVWA